MNTNTVMNRKARHQASTFLSAVFVLLLAGCAGTDRSAELAAAEMAEQARQEQLLAEQAAVEREAQLAREQREAELARREAEEQAREQARQAALQEAEEAEARRQAELARQAAAREAELARQQARIEALQARIAATRAETAGTDAENEVLREAVRAAENLAAALNEEGQKYSNVDPDTGITIEELAGDRLAELGAELERIRLQLNASQNP